MNKGIVKTMKNTITKYLLKVRLAARISVRYIVYYWKLLHVVFMDKTTMGRVVIKNNLYILPFKDHTHLNRHMQLKDINDFDIEGLTGIEYADLEECVVAIYRYNRDK